MVNQIYCSPAGANTGIPDCALTLKNIIGGFLVPNSFVLSAANLATSDTLLAALQAASVNDNPTLRVYPLPRTVGITDNTEEPTVETFGYGQQIVVRDGVYSWTFRYTVGGNCVSNALRKFNGLSHSFIGVDAAGVVFGTKVGDTLKGIPLDQFYAAPAKVNDGSATAMFQYTVTFQAVYFNEGLGFIQGNVADIIALQGLKNISLSLPIPRATNVIKVKAMTGCNGFDLYDTFPTILAEASNYRVTRNGASVTITSVVADPNLKAFTITLDATDPDYNAAGPFLVFGNVVSSLIANGLMGYEIGSVYVA